MKILSNFSKKSKLRVLLIAILVMILGGIGIFIANNGSNNILGINLPGIKGETVDSETAQAGSEKSTLEKAIEKNAILSETENIKLEDAYGNQVIVPAGFKVTNDATDVTGGVVIEDGDGNQFVWVPVGKVKDGTDSTHTITLSRYDFDATGKKTDKGTSPISVSATDTTATCQELAQSTVYPNAKAKDINAYKTSVDNNKGYYIGRYEARTKEERTSSSGELPEVTENKNDYVYNNVSQLQASELSQKMYTSDNFSSDLVNSYAWDTAIVFLQEFDNRVNKTTPYSRVTSINSTFAKTGTNNTDHPDKICNIYDMASNAYEKTTETCNHSSLVNTSASLSACVYRGGLIGDINYYTSRRGFGAVNSASSSSTFRPILYIEGAFSEYKDSNSGNTGDSEDDEMQGDDPATSQEVSAKDIADAENKEDVYGKQVTSYKVDGIDVNWDIFYSDGTNIYLIAEDYIERDKLPQTTQGHKPNDGNLLKDAYFTEVLSDYNRL